MSTEFFTTSLIVVLLPGTGVIYTISVGLLRGGRSSMFAALGCTTGIIPHMIASILGLATILHMSALAFQAIKMTGVVYLLYLAWSMWKESGALKFEGEKYHHDAWKIVIKGFLINILNPKLSLFFLAFLPQFVPPQTETPISTMLVLSGIFMGMTLLVFILYGLFANRVSRYVVSSAKTIKITQRSFAAIFAMLAVRLALTER